MSPPAMGPHFQRILEGINKERTLAQRAPLTADDLQKAVDEGWALELTLKKLFGEDYRLVIMCEGHEVRMHTAVNKG